MKITKEMIIIFGLSLIGIFLNQFVPLPASIIALLLLFLLLIFKIIQPTHIKNLSTFFLNYMSIFFIPTTVKIMIDYKLISQSIFKYLIVCILSTVFTFFISGNVVKLLMKLGGKKNERSH